MLVRLLLLMTVVPAIELYLLMQLADVMGIVETITLIVVTGTVGASLAKREGYGVINQLREDLQKGLPPADRLVEGLLVLVGGTLLITPGVLTDLAGFSLIFPFTRRWLAPRVKAWAAAKVNLKAVHFGGAAGPRQPTARRPSGTGQPEFTRPEKPPDTGFDHPER
ncbi:MAG: hypothetical protein CL927_03140 [Deltaproteobacteria bacterium]|nr:hypothetical protein [Deltaproteobacteria bacterium]